MFTNAYPRIGKIVKEARQGKGITQQELSLALGYTNCQYLSNFERGTSTMSAENLGKICAILEIPDDYIQTILVDEYSKKLKVIFKEGIGEIVQKQRKAAA